ncbi:jg13356 [Pararge aegeria aegeria]|uniref:protein-tyrosine-phosphatase n=1 Tax=Pararge aegeria aegeria TaxID=348720 RepID=A0A8S4S2F6_9NEOP|nr:jg13356 [Pararge aegeria aegeria]
MVRRVAPQFSIPPPPRTEVMLGSNLTLKCVAFGSPMPTVKWKKGLTKWLTPEDNPPLGLNTLKLEDIRESANYTCEAASVLGVIETTAEVKVQYAEAVIINLKLSSQNLLIVNDKTAA